jgi:transposase-like protein
MTLADQAAIAGHDGQVTSGKPERPKSRTFTREFKAKIVAEFGALPANSPEHGALLRKNRLCHSRIEDWRRQLDSDSPASGGKKEKPAKAAESAELARLPHGLLSRRRTGVTGSPPPSSRPA